MGIFVQNPVHLFGQTVLTEQGGTDQTQKEYPTDPGLNFMTVDTVVVQTGQKVLGVADSNTLYVDGDGTPQTQHQLPAVAADLAHVLRLQWHAGACSFLFGGAINLPALPLAGELPVEDGFLTPLQFIVVGIEDRVCFPTA